MHGFDEPSVAGPIPEGPTDLLDTGGQRCVRDCGVLPNGREELVLADDAAGLAGQDREDGQGLRGQPNLLLASLEPLHRIQPIGTESDHQKVVLARGTWPAARWTVSGSHGNAMTLLRLLRPRRPIVRAITVADNGSGQCNQATRERPPVTSRRRDAGRRRDK